jgi:hypothetical protein
LPSLSYFFRPFVFRAVASFHDDVNSVAPVSKEFIWLTTVENSRSYCQLVNLFEQN